MYSSGSPNSSSSLIGGGGGSGAGGGVSGRSKRYKRGAWGARERAGMSFLIVVIFFAIFGIIIITEVFMIDERGRAASGVGGVRHVNMGNRFGESVPDYEDVKDDYSLDEAGLFGRERGDIIKENWNPNNFNYNNKVFNVMTGVMNRQMGSSRMGNINHLSKGIPVMGDGDFQQGKSVYSPTNNNVNTNNNFRRNQIQMMPLGQMLPGKVEETLPRYPSLLTSDGRPTDGSWQVVNGTRFKFFVYSAFYDRRNGRMVRVVGATKTRTPERVWCRLWYPQQNGSYHSVTLSSRVKVIRENWNLKYSACFVMCPLREQNLSVPYAISIVARLRVPPKNLLLVRNSDLDPDIVKNFNYSAYNSGISTSSNNNNNNMVINSSDTSLINLNQNGNSKAFLEGIPNGIGVCVKPFHFNYDNAFYFMEFLELNALLGVKHFTFYNHTIGPRASCILKYYMRPNFRIKVLEKVVGNETVEPISITILPWDLKMKSQKEIRTEGLFAALNDCLYRSMYRYSHVALIDLDEFIIPRHNKTLTEMLEWLSRKVNSKNTGSYSFQNAFFYLQFADDSQMYEKSKVGASLLTQRKTQRKKKLHPQKQRSKYICKPEAVVEAGNHFVWEFTLGRGSLNVPADTAILHHYRVCEFGGDDCVKTMSVVDRTAHKHGDSLEKRVDAMYKSLKVKCNLAELPPPPTKPPPSKATKKSAVPLINATRNVLITPEMPKSTSSKAKVNSTTQTHHQPQPKPKATGDNHSAKRAIVA